MSVATSTRRYVVGSATETGAKQKSPTPSRTRPAVRAERLRGGTVPVADDPRADEQVGRRGDRAQPAREVAAGRRGSLTASGHDPAVLGLQVDGLERDLLHALREVRRAGSADGPLTLGLRMPGCPDGLDLEREFGHSGARIGDVQLVVREDEAGDPAACVQRGPGAALEDQRQEVVEEVALAVLEIAHVREAGRDVGVEALHRPQEGLLDLAPRRRTSCLGGLVHREERCAARLRRHELARASPPTRLPHRSSMAHARRGSGRVMTTGSIPLGAGVRPDRGAGLLRGRARDRLALGVPAERSAGRAAGRGAL